MKGKQIALKDKRNIKKQTECAYIVNVTMTSKTYTGFTRVISRTIKDKTEYQ